LFVCLTVERDDGMMNLHEYSGGMRMRNRVMVSQCLLGIRCRYDGACAAKEAVSAAACAEGWIPVCPEILGGMTTPRLPAERVGDRVVNSAGDDVTDHFRRGADEALKLAELYGVKYALLKERSPSCGAGMIYDGTFSGSKVAGDGVTTALFKEAGIEVFGESRLQELLDRLREDET